MRHGPLPTSECGGATVSIRFGLELVFGTDAGPADLADCRTPICRSIAARDTDRANLLTKGVSSWTSKARPLGCAHRLARLQDVGPDRDETHRPVGALASHTFVRSVEDQILSKRCVMANVEPKPATFPGSTCTIAKPSVESTVFSVRLRFQAPT